MIFNWLNKKIKNFKWWDISLIKLSTFAFALMIAKLWSQILSLQWHWYLVISIVIAIPVLWKTFCISKK
ncbi:MAG: hypothetical protein ACTSXL_00540 [Alphaproteobacteria bacterium]